MSPSEIRCAKVDKRSLRSYPVTQAIVGESAHTRQLLQLVRSIAPTAASVLINGESGAGKELVAQAIHDQSDRSDRPFVAVNCGAIPAELMESELFGHKKGAFTGAIADHIGKVAAADGGTLFLDEIGDMPMNMQVKLLRVLQEKVVLPVGSNQPQSVDIRVVAATHRVLEDEIKAGRFRADLYYRLNVVPLQVQPLRSRREELPALIRHFAKHFASEDNPAIAFTDGFLEVMRRYDWPGNVRELSNMIHRLSVLYPGQTLHMNHVAPSMLPVGMAELVTETTDSDQGSLFDMMMQDDASASDDVGAVEAENDIESIVMHAQGFEDFRQRGQSLKGMLSDIEQDLIERALQESDGNVSRCAKLLRMQRTTLIERIKKYNLKMHAA